MVQLYLNQYIFQISQKLFINVIIQNINSITLECVGPEEMSLKDILKKLLKLIGKKGFYFQCLYYLQRFTAFFTVFYQNR